MARAVSPWTSFYHDIRRVQTGNNAYYKTGPNQTDLYYIVHWACYCIRQRNYPDAFAQTRDGIFKAPDNPVFNYLEAAANSSKGDISSALKAIDSGNNKGKLLLYTSEREPPDQWEWPEINIICYTGKRLAVNNGNSKPALITILKMGQNVLECEPADLTQILQGIDLQQLAAKELLKLAKKDRDTPLEKICIELLRETHGLAIAIHRSLSDTGTGRPDTQALIVGRTAGNTNRRLRDTSILLYRERQAEQVDRLRKQFLKNNLLEGLD